MEGCASRLQLRLLVVSAVCLMYLAAPGAGARILQTLPTVDAQACSLPYCGGNFVPYTQYRIRSNNLGTCLAAAPGSPAGTMPVFGDDCSGDGGVWFFDAGLNLVHADTGLCLSANHALLADAYPPVTALALSATCATPLRIYGCNSCQTGGLQVRNGTSLCVYPQYGLALAGRPPVLFGICSVEPRLQYDFLPLLPPTPVVMPSPPPPPAPTCPGDCACSGFTQQADCEACNHCIAVTTDPLRRADCIACIKSNLHMYDDQQMACGQCAQVPDDTRRGVCFNCLSTWSVDPPTCLQEASDGSGLQFLPQLVSITYNTTTDICLGYTSEFDVVAGIVNDTYFTEALFDYFNALFPTAWGITPEVNDAGALLASMYECHLYKGYFRPNATGVWTFQVKGNDGMDIWIGEGGTYGTPITSSLIATQHQLDWVTRSKFLVEGTFYPLFARSCNCVSTYTRKIQFQGPTGFTEFTQDGTGFYYHVGDQEYQEYPVDLSAWQ